jgi:hypothetical protein
MPDPQLQGVSLWAWAMLGIVLTSLAFAGSRRWGPWLLILTVVIMVSYAKDNGRI